MPGGEAYIELLPLHLGFPGQSHCGMNEPALV